MNDVCMRVIIKNKETDTVNVNSNIFNYTQHSTINHDRRNIPQKKRDKSITNSQLPLKVCTTYETIKN